MDKANIFSVSSAKGNNLLADQSAEQTAFYRADDQPVHCNIPKA